MCWFCFSYQRIMSAAADVSALTLEKKDGFNGQINRQADR